MQLPENRFKRAIMAGRQQIGLWCSLPLDRNGQHGVAVAA